MSIFKEYEKIQQRKVAKQAVGVAAGGIIALFIAGWILFLTYNAFRPDAWPYLGLWTAFGASYLFNYACNRLRGTDNG